MGWQIELTATAAKQLGKVDPAVARRIRSYLRERVTDDPRRVGKPLQGQLAELWRYRIGDYRVICELQDEKLVVLILRIAHRRHVY